MFIAYKYTVGSETTAAKDGPPSRRQLRDALSQISVLGRYFSVNANEAVIEVASQDASFDIESLFRSHRSHHSPSRPRPRPSRGTRRRSLPETVAQSAGSQTFRGSLAFP